MDVSIIIVNYHTAHLIEPLLETIFSKTVGISYEIIVVDNDPTPQEKSTLAPYTSQISYLPLSQNVGFGRANNEGLKVAQGNYILFLNPDTLLVNNAIAEMFKFLESHPQAGICGGNLYDVHMSPIHSGMVTLPSPVWDLNNLLGNLVFKLKYGKNVQHNFTDQPLKVGYVTGADMMVRKEILHKIGGFDPDFFMYYEETELSYRVQKLGYSSYLIPQAKIIHLEGKSSETSDKREKMKSVSKRMYYKKTQGLFFYYLSNLLSFFNCILRMIYAKVRKNQEEYTYWLLIFKNI